MYNWQTVNKNGWSYQEDNMNSHYIAFRMDSLPDLSSPRFQYLGERSQDRKNELLKKQLQMIKRIHDLEGNWSVSLRYRREEQGINLYVIFRKSFYGNYDSLIEENEISALNNLLPEEYSFSRCKHEELLELFGTESFFYGAEILKKEEILEGNIQSYYSPEMFAGISGDYKVVASALMQCPIKTTIDITLVATEFLLDEKQWINNLFQQLKEVQQGERIKNDEGRTLKQFDPIPMFSGYADNAKKMLEKYAGDRMFLSSVRVFSSEEITPVCNALISGTLKNQPQILRCRYGEKAFEKMIRAYQNVDISILNHTRLWMEEQMPYRAQRLNRLYSAEEISHLFRIPLSIESHFPGFHLDTGLGTSGNKRKAHLAIEIGNYIDEGISSDNKAEFSAQQLAKHALIVGVPGSGKTTAMFNILHQLWSDNKTTAIPFIVMEPAKTEFRALKTVDIFRNDMLVFSLGDDRTSPFRFNPFDVLPGIPLERHISRLNACFIGAFDLFDPLPLLLDQAIRRTYMEKGWFEDSIGGEEGVETPTLTDLCRNVEYIIDHSGFDTKMISDFKASLLQRLNSLRRGSKGRMLDTKHSIPMDELMKKPVILELDALNEDEKSLMMMFMLSYVFEYCKVQRKSGSLFKHLLVVEEAHNLIGKASSSDGRANPKEQTINLFVNMLAEMRALGEGILIADQLPTAIAPQAVKQTNVKILMRVTARDDREEIGNTMDLTEAEMKNVVHFKTGHAYIFHEEMDKVRMVRMVNYKGIHQVEEPPSDQEMHEMMKGYIMDHPDIYLPFEECKQCCSFCTSRVRSQAQQFCEWFFREEGEGTLHELSKADMLNKKGFGDNKVSISFCKKCILGINQEAKRLIAQYGSIDKRFPLCAFFHMKNIKKELFDQCKDCPCSEQEQNHILKLLNNIGG